MRLHVYKGIIALQKLDIQYDTANEWDSTQGLNPVRVGKFVTQLACTFPLKTGKTLVAQTLIPPPPPPPDWPSHADFVDLNFEHNILA